MKRLKYLLIIGVLSLVTGCQNQSSIEEPVSEETNEPEQVIEETSQDKIDQRVKHKELDRRHAQIDQHAQSDVFQCIFAH